MSNANANANSNANSIAIKETVEAFLADWDRHEWMNTHGEWDEDEECVEEGVIDPDGVAWVEDDERRQFTASGLLLRSGPLVAKNLDGWNCSEGWVAYQVGSALYVNWFRSPYGRGPNRSRRERDLWVCVEPAYFDEAEDE